VPEELKTAKLCLEAVKSNAAALNYVPEGLIEESVIRELCLAAVQGDTFLEDIPRKYLTAEACAAAVKRRGSDFDAVPPKMRDYAVYLAAFNDMSTSLKLDKVPKKFRTAELCRLAVEKDGSALEYVPKRLVTAELALAAAKRSSLSGIPEKFRTIKVCLAASKSFGDDGWDSVPRKIRDTVRELHKKGVRPEVLPG
jgi:hypothetical protein